MLFRSYASPSLGGPILTLAMDEGRGLTPGQKLAAKFDPSRAMLFDTAGQRIR